MINTSTISQLGYCYLFLSSYSNYGWWVGTHAGRYNYDYDEYGLWRDFDYHNAYWRAESGDDINWDHLLSFGLILKE